MKIIVDIKLSLDTLQTPSKDSLQLSNFALKLHKSILKYENSDFTMALSMFPNKIKAESYGNSRVFYGERKIVCLMKEKIIQESKDFKVGVTHYKKLKKDIKK